MAYVNSFKQFGRKVIKEQQAKKLEEEQGNAVFGPKAQAVQQEILNLETQIQDLNTIKLQKMKTDLPKAQEEDAAAEASKADAAARAQANAAPPVNTPPSPNQPTV